MPLCTAAALWLASGLLAAAETELRSDGWGRPAEASKQALDVDTCKGEACTLSALQVSTARNGPLTSSSKNFRTETVESAKGKWFYSQEEFFDQWSIPLWLRKSSMQELGEGIFKSSTAFFMHGGACENWNGYFWPRISFWAQEFRKREQRVAPDDAAAGKRLFDWASAASYFACVPKADPRAGQNWSEPVNAWMKQVFESDGSLDMPPLGPFFYMHSLEMVATSECQFWLKSLMCDVSYWSHRLKGTADWGDGYCWDKVRHPGYAFTTYNMSTAMGMEKRPAEIADDLHHREYLQCQEHGLDEAYFRAVCPFGGHYHDGFLGVSSWGEGVPEADRAGVLQCQAKLGGPPKVELLSPIYAWDPEIGLMSCANGMMGCLASSAVDGSLGGTME